MLYLYIRRRGQNLSKNKSISGNIISRLPTFKVDGLWNQTGPIILGSKIKQQLWIATNRDGLSHTIPVYGPVNLLVLWRRESIGNLGLFFTAATTNFESGAVYSATIGVRCRGGPYGGSSFGIQGKFRFQYSGGRWLATTSPRRDHVREARGFPERHRFVSGPPLTK